MPYASKSVRKSYILKRINENRVYVRSLKESSPCADCGKFYPYYVMHYDHLGNKRGNVSLMMSHSRETLDAEIAKCELVCANCHAIRTHDRNQYGDRSQTVETLGCEPSVVGPTPTGHPIASEPSGKRALC